MSKSTQTHKAIQDQRLDQQRLASQKGLAVIRRLENEIASAVISFGGQGAGWLDELRALYQQGGLATQLIETTAHTLKEMSDDRRIAWSGVTHQGVELLQWIKDPSSVPDSHYLTSSFISQSMIFTTQLSRYAACWEAGLRSAFERGSIRGVTGHSQGILAATLVSESPRGEISPARFADYIRYLCWQGLHMERSGRPAPSDSGTCMAAISGIPLSRLEVIIARANRLLKETAQVTIALQNTRSRNVLSGHPHALSAVHTALEQLAEKEKGLKKAGRFGGSPLQFTWEDLPVGGPYHTHHMRAGFEAMQESVSEMSFSISEDALEIPVYLCADGSLLGGDVVGSLLESQFLNPVRWQKTLLRILSNPEVTHILDMGPSDAVAKLSLSAIRGTGVSVIPLSLERGRAELFEASHALPPMYYGDFTPSLAQLSNGQLIIDNRYTRSTGESPVILPGMTPTTVDSLIVSAAANAGYTSELAGGGQVTEAIFRKRIAELKTQLQPGAEIVFNSLFLDPYLWDLHFRRSGIVLKLKKEGAPIKGVTISAGLPEVEEATALLDEFEANGIWHNAFKPGNVAQVKHVCSIAAANPEKTIFMHLEGGKAGGHHSWEDLDELLLETYHLIRAQANLILCVGGGIATERRGVELLSGQWSLAHGMLPMPVDAILLGTVTMAAREATATPSVKQALAGVSGCDDWVFAGEREGGMTSGKSQLNADIHYVDNSASRCGRLLDTVAGNAEAVEAKRSEIITALSKTCKPYFGELVTMTYAQVLKRMVELMAVGDHTPYEDGIWPDASYRGRIADFIRMTEARLAPQDEGMVESVLSELSELDHPQEVIERLIAAYPQSTSITLHPLDREGFIHRICARPGKPVNFVPVLDADVRRWFKSDSLWQAQNSHYTADQVLIIPGPEAIRGIAQADEPIADLLWRFERALIEELTLDDPLPIRVEGHWNLGGSSELPQTSDTRNGSERILSIGGDVDAQTWFAILARSGTGLALGALVAPWTYKGGCAEANPLQALCRPISGACFTLIEDQERRVHRISYVTPWGESVEISADQNHITAQAAPHIAGGSTTSLELSFRGEARAKTTYFIQDEVEREAAIARFYQGALFGTQLEAPPLFTPARDQLIIDRDQVQAYHAITGGFPTDEVPLNMIFSIAWKPIFTVMSTADLSRGLLRLVHLSNDFELHAGWPLHAGDTVEVVARVTRLENRAQGRTIETSALLSRGDEPCATLRSAFFVRQSFGEEARLEQGQSQETWTLQIRTEAEADILNDLQWIHLEEGRSIRAGDTLEVEGDIEWVHLRDASSSFGIQGSIQRQQELIGRVEGSWAEGFTHHPAETLFTALEHSLPAEVPCARQTLARVTAKTPIKMEAFAEIGRDLNPIHVSPMMAWLGGMDDVIVHGMWTSARAHAFLVTEVVAGEASRIRSWKGEFLSPALLGETLELRAVRVASKQSDALIEVSVEALREGQKIPVMRAQARVQSPSIAYIFPGQGIQQKGMGMSSYASSAAARQIWDQADQFTREKLGFSILQVVRTNPREIIVNGTPQVHERGVLHLTQFTQVAMAVLAQAQVAQLRDAGLLNEAAIVCGHSVGEYNAIGALGGVLPLETIVQTVYERGCEMHRLVDRDEQGESGYRMGVIRPHYAGLDEAGAEALVNQISEALQLPLQIVNYNIMGRQYSVVGKIEAINVLQHKLAELAPQSTKPAYIEVPGIDVPFHSRVLAGGVNRFRATLESRFPAVIPVDKLIGRYIPNLVPKLFTLDREFVEEVYEYTRSEPLQLILEDWERASQDPDQLGRALLIELLAWQFASPVRWIETQALLLSRPELGGVGVSDILELGVGYQPTLSNMAKYTRELLRGAAAKTRIRNIEADEDEVFFRVEDSPERGAEPLADDHDTTSSVSSDATSPDSESATLAPSIPRATPAVAPAGPVEDRPFSVREGLVTMLALQARLSPKQIQMNETIDEIFDGVSSRRNQILMDMGVEFNVGSIDGAHEQPLEQLVLELEKRASQYQSAGKYLSASIDEGLKRVLGRAGLSRKEVGAYFEEQFGLGAGLNQSALITLMIETREGDSSRGGALGTLGAIAPSSKPEAHALLDQVVQYLGSQAGLTLPKRAAGAGGGHASVDAAVVRELEDKILGRDGVLMQTARGLATRLGHPLEASKIGLSEASEEVLRLDGMIAEHSKAYEELIQPVFSLKKHVAFTSIWAWAQRDVARLAISGVSGALDAAQMLQEALRLAHLKSPRVESTARWFEAWATARGHAEVAGCLRRIIEDEGDTPLHWIPTRPSLHLDVSGRLHYEEIPARGADARSLFIDQLQLLDPQSSIHIGAGGSWNTTFREVLQEGVRQRHSFEGKTIVVTGAGPNSIALEMVKHFLHGGARVVLTTSSYHAQRLEMYRALYQSTAGRGAELHIVPFNQTSLRDVDALVDWLFSTQTEQAGAEVKVTKRPFVPDMIVPFAALKDLATLDTLGARSQAALRTMLLSVEALITGISRKYKELGIPEDPCHVILPLSPNHGVFGGDGTYAETKAALEVLAHKWSSEWDAWGRCTSLCMAKIGWVRGTGLMDANNSVAVALEEQTGVRTFSNAEMAALLVALCSPRARAEASRSPLWADLTGGFSAVRDLKSVVDGIRADLEMKVRHARAREDLQRVLTKAPQDRVLPPVQAVPQWPVPTFRLHQPSTVKAKAHPPLSEMIVIVGLGEVGPCGSMRTRFELEVSQELSPAAVLELAWMTGLISYEKSGRGGAWRDLESGEEVQEWEIAARYHDAVKARSGIRFTDPESAGFDPRSLEVMTPVFLEQDMTFTVASEEEARIFCESDPEHTLAHFDDELEVWKVTRRAGTEVRVPRRTRLNRYVTGQIPSGFDPNRYGIPKDMIENTDRLTLFNLIATVDAFVSAGLSPEELLRWIHPARIANTQGCGIGGMESLQRLYTDPVLDRERQSDVLQETLINVVAGYVVQAYVGSYGPMSNPVSACATAAVSLEEAVDKLLVGKADWVVAGGYDDIGRAGFMGFADMNATHNSDEMLEMGLEPHQFSRSNDVRRRGFVEAQGGGTFLVTRGDIALKMGLPVRAIVGYAASFGDGIQKSVPAPGLGALASVLGGARSPLAQALQAYGLSADDIALVYKHDTSTNANDPNENKLHDSIQRALGRTQGNPLWVVSQKTLTGHSKGGAAAWQLGGLIQSLSSGIIPGNRNLDSVDPLMEAFGHMAFTNESLFVGQGELKAGMITSLGFGHVSGLALILHPDLFFAAIPEEERDDYFKTCQQRQQREIKSLAAAWLGDEPFFTKRSERRFASADGTSEQTAEEVTLLMDPQVRLGEDGIFSRGDAS